MTETVHRYRIHGRVVGADIALEGLTPDAGDVDVQLHLTAPLPALDGDRVRVRGEAGEVGRFFDRYASGWEHWHYPDGTAFVIAPDARAVWVQWTPPLTLADALTYLYGPVLGYLERRRGRLALHGSVLRLADGAVACCGIGGAGKSTLAAAATLEGFAAMSDDVATLEEAREGWQVHGGYDHLRLWPSSEAALLRTEDALPRLTPTWNKKRFDLPVPSAAGVPLCGILVLDPVRDAGDGTLERLAPMAALRALLPLTFGTALLRREDRATELGQLERL
ncbi:MAG: hypothetical protein K2X99_00970, partial [Gemmatimonadaceae bacterium]|nr:hypothetical protein [Gemmatimonadaceae bacterium]